MRKVSSIQPGLNFIRASTFLVLLVFPAGAAQGAAPRVIIAYGSPLDRPVVMDQWEENHEFMLAITDPANIDPKILDGRTYVELAFFWGPEWVRYVEEGKPPDALTPQQANQHGRFYPSVNGADAIVELDHVNYRKIRVEGLQILARSGVPVEGGRKRPWSAAWLIVGMLGLLLLLAIAMLVRARAGRTQQA